MIFYYLGYLPLVYVYGEKRSGSNDQFKRIQVKINDMIRATGLTNTTPQNVLDKCLGTNLEKFAEQGVICDGLKMLKFHKINPFDRTNKIRLDQPFSTPGTYLYKFRELWNNLDTDLRNEYKDLKPNQVKVRLKERRKLKYEPEIFEQYKWFNYNTI